MTLFSGEVSPITTVAVEDVELIVISHTDEILQFIQGNAQFATDMIQLIENRKRQVRIALDSTHSENVAAQTTRNGQGNAVNGVHQTLGRVSSSIDPG